MVEQWMAQHAPGGRMLLMGPQCAVLLPAEVGSQLATSLWPTIQGEPSPVALVNTLTGAGLDSLHDFALLVADGQRVRCLVRGDVRVSDIDSGEVLADGGGLLTWREASLTGVRGVRLGRAEEPARLPLRVGAAMVSHADITFDGSDPTPREHEPAAEQSPAAVAIPAPLAPDEAGTPQSPESGPELAPSPSDHDGMTIFQRDIAATHKPSEEPPSQVLAAPCVEGHANPPGSHSCRICGAPVEAGTPQIVRRPPLGLLVASDGQSVELDQRVLVGRAPSADGFGPGVRLLTVPSPNQDISRSHLLIAPDGWAIEATDLESTNGTLLMRRGQEPIRLLGQQPTLVQIGDVLDLGDGVTVEVTNPTL